MHASRPVSVLALEETRSASGLTFSDGVEQLRLSRSCGRLGASFWPTSRCSSSTARENAFKVSEVPLCYSNLEDSLSLDRKSFSWPFFGPRCDLLSRTTQFLPESAQIPHFGLTRSQRALRRRHSSQASPGCCRVLSPVVVTMALLTMMADYLTVPHPAC